MEGIMNGEALFEAAMEENREWADKVYIKDGCLVLNISYEYAVDLSRIDTKEKVLAWIHHLTEKNWASVKMFHYMMAALEKHFEMKFDMPI